MQSRVPPDPVREAHGIDDSPLGRIDRKPLPSLGDLLATLQTERGRSEDVNFGRGVVDARTMGAARDGDVDDGGQLVGQIPVSQRGVQADDASRDTRTDRRQIRAGADRAAGHAKNPTARTKQVPAGAQTVVPVHLGCLLMLGGRLRRLGGPAQRVLHVAEVIAGETD